MPDSIRVFRYYNTSKGGRNTTAPSGLVGWAGVDSGWDNSPRWDHGIVEAIDLNGWLHLDQLFLAQMARDLGKDPAEVHGWAGKAAAVAALVQSRLWAPTAGVFWDRVPANARNATVADRLVKVVTPATLWSLLAGIATPAQAAAQVKVRQL